ncbi:MAG TPA: SO2930 family diheme c-type cytochrome [Saprospiraceae bacterium]|nr:SO2930 family diheme c-type cytochrome [Saprospiraceae bacterium]HPI06254.1 SO2930 family diheme c-type cytochrome [Saprospiraceae bacterium]
MSVHIKLFGLIIAGIILLASTSAPDAAVKQKLSEYGFFSGDPKALQPADQVFAYEVNAPLFSDYAEKARFIYLPAGTKMTYRENGAFDFPDGTAIIKNFYYFTDAAHPDQGRRIIETRLLLKEPKGWKALAYIWNAEQTDALLEVAGATMPVSWNMASGKKQDLQYVVPNLNQCKGCHSYDGQFTPIGVSAKQLNMSLPEQENQLLALQKLGRLDLPASFDPLSAGHLTDYRKRENNLEQSARSYLDANCAHCHNPHGPASTSGMFLEVQEINPERLGIGKPPVAAGRGSGNLKYGIVPGKPSESILLYRMEHTDPGIRMPELGRQMVHEEGVALIKSWIKNM